MNWLMTLLARRSHPAMEAIAVDDQRALRKAGRANARAERLIAEYRAAEKASGLAGDALVEELRER